MWVNRQLFDMIVADNKAQAERLNAVWNTCHLLQGKHDAATTQKAKDDVTIDWMRHRINALEKQNSILVMKTSGVIFPVPEIVPTRPGSISDMSADFNHMPSFEDIGEAEAARLGIQHDEFGQLQYADTRK